MLSDVYKTKTRFKQHLVTQAANVDQFATELGLDNDQTKGIKEDAALMEWFDQKTELATTFKESVTGAYNRFFSTHPEPAIGEFVAAPTLTPPTAPLAGAVERSKQLDRLMLAHQPSQNALEAMDLLGDETSSLTPNEIKPTVEAFAAATGYHFAAVISNRGDATVSDIYVCRVGQTKWTKAESGTGKSVNVTVEPIAGEEGKPIQLLARVQLRKSNQDYGQVSEPAVVTVNP